jgi:uncharacterized protein (DUF58 family)
LLATVRSRLELRVAAWAHRRQGDDVLPVTMQARRVYIVPTRTGIMFAVLLIVMLVAGLNYNNSVALLLTFMLAGYAILGIHETQRNLKGLRVVHAGADDSFAGDAGRIELRFENTLHTARGPITAHFEDHSSVPLALPPRSVTARHVDYLRTRRGRHRLGRIKLQTTAPLGLFRSWCWLYLPLEALVYPAPRGMRPLPVAAGHHRSDGSDALAAGNDEWTALRPFVEGDSPRAVAWKLYARGAPLLVSQYAGAAGAKHTLDYAALGALSVEARLEQLCAWILRCEAAREAYCVRLPGRELPRGVGTEQRLRALRALALHGAGPA